MVRPYSGRDTVPLLACNRHFFDALNQTADGSGGQSPVAIASSQCDCVGTKTQHCSMIFGEMHRKPVSRNDDAKIR
jgi:hypothetical protein